MGMAAPRKRWSGDYRREAEAQSRVTGQARADLDGQARYARTLRSWSPGQQTASRREQSQHQLGAVHVAIKVLGDQAAACDVVVKRRKASAKEGKGEDDSEALPHDHALCRLLRRPNNKETGGMYRRQMVQQLCLTGDSLTWRLDDGNGVPAEMWSIPSGTWQPLMAGGAGALYPDGAYLVTPYFAFGPFLTFPGMMAPGGVVIPSEETLRVKYPHPLVTYDAYSPLTACATQLEALESVDRSRLYGMRQGIRPSAVVESDGATVMPDQDELDRMKEEFSSKYGGPEATGRVAVLSPGLKISPYSHAPFEMGWEASWSQLVDFVLSVFGTTKTLAFMGEASSYAALYASLKQFNLLSMTPLLQMLADAINVQLVWPFWGDDHFVELRPRAVDDEDAVLAKMNLCLSGGLTTVNENRVMLKMKPVEWGEDRAFLGRDTQKATDAGQEGPPGDAPPGGAPAGKPKGKPKGAETEAPAAEAARPTPGKQSAGSLPGRRLAGGKGLNGRH